MTTMPSELALKRREIKHRLIKIHVGELGTTEHGDNLQKYGEWYGMNGVPWCAEYQSWVAAHGHATLIIPRFAYTPAGALWFLARDAFGHHPRVGALVFFDLAGLGRISHVGYVVKVYPDGSWDSIEGNTNALGSREGTTVRRQHRTTTGRLGGFGYPDYSRLARVELAA